MPDSLEERCQVRERDAPQPRAPRRGSRLPGAVERFAVLAQRIEVAGLMEVDAPHVVQHRDLALAIADGPGERKRCLQLIECGRVMRLVELCDAEEMDCVRLAAPVSERTMNVGRFASPRGGGVVLPLRRGDLAQRIESRAQRDRIGGPQLRKEGFVGLLRFAKRAPLLQRPRVVERQRPAQRRARQ